MAIIYTDPNHAGAVGAAFGSGGNAGNIYASPTSWPTNSTMESGNTYRFKRGATLTLTKPIRTVGGEASKITVMPYYNSDGTDDTSQGYAVVDSGRVTVTTDWTSEGSNVWRLTGAGAGTDPDYYIFWGLHGTTVGRRRDTTNTGTGTWGGAGVDVFANNFEYNYQSAPSGTIHNKVYCTVNPAATPATAPIVANFTKSDRDTFTSGAFYIKKNTGGFEMWGIEVKNALRCLVLDMQSTNSLWPGVHIHHNFFHYCDSGIFFQGGSTSNTTGFTGLKIEYNRIDTCANGGIQYGGIGGTGNPVWGCYGGATVATGASYIMYNIISNTCMGIGTGGIYISRHGCGGGGDKLWVQYNSIGKVYFGRYWRHDGHGIYCENSTTDIMVHNNYMWDVYKAMIHKPWTAGNGSFKYNVGLCDSSPSGSETHSFFWRSISDNDPSGMTYTTLHYNIAKGFPRFLTIQDRWGNYEDVDVKGGWSRGVSTTGVKNSGILAEQGPGSAFYVGSLVAPALDMHLVGHDTGTSKIFYSELPSDDPAHPGTTNWLNAGDRTEGAVVGPSGRTANGFIVNDNDNTASLAIFNQLPHAGDNSLHDIEVNYATALTDSFWSQIDTSIIPEAAGFLLNTLRLRRS